MIKALHRLAAARALIGIAGPSAGSAVDELRELRRQDAAGDSDDISGDVR